VNANWHNFAVYSSEPKDAGYKVRFYFRAIQLAKKSPSSELSLSWKSITCRDYSQSHDFRIILPEKYDVRSVISDGRNLDYAKSMERNRVIVDFKVIVPPKGSFPWTATAQPLSSYC
jgi:hypothetical protein